MSERTLAGVDGEPVATYRAIDKGPTPFAVFLHTEPDVAPEDLAAAAVVTLAGWKMATRDEALVAALVGSGARIARRSTHMERRFPGSWPQALVPAGMRVSPLSADPAQLLPASLAAFPFGHDDRADDSSDDDEARELAELLAGEITGPLLPEASWAVLDARDRTVGGVIVTRQNDGLPGDGTWIAWILAHPELAPPGTGSALLAATLTALSTAGEPHVGLSVTVGNPAQRLYERFGFEPLARNFTLVLPSAH